MPGDVLIEVDATDDEEVTYVGFWIDGDYAGADTSSPFAYSWNSRFVFNGDVDVLARAYDRDEQTDEVEVTYHVSNALFTPLYDFDFEDADHASGVVYCRDELERQDSEEWGVGTIQYWDDYERIDGQWCFRRRRFHRWYIVDALERPSHGAGVADEGTLTSHQLPEAWPSWGEFWAEAD